ncbi:MAG: hypothetical protein HY670_02180 [Chloroflexi bacterium]|nr:hypothetical protein [Chloroflexota bacterium]
MTKRLMCFLTAAGLLLGLLSNGCRAKPTPTPSPAPANTVGQFASSGRTVFITICSNCHGEQGQGITGPALIGSNAFLEKFENAQRLFEYISIAMPQEAPGSLTRQEYLEVLSYLMLQNGFIDEKVPFDPDGLEKLPLKK